VSRRRRPLAIAARKGWPVLALVAVFLTVGVPRRLVGDDGPPAGSRADANFAKVCRDHGGTPATPSGSGPNAQDQRCTVRYGRHVYLMDAITPHGFDEDTARFQRQGCAEARRQQKAADAPGHPRRAFVYHPASGVCERRP
jgi:hypothetical protein